jgi:hypothetical protein
MDWLGLLIAGSMLVLTGLGYRFLWPLVKDHWLVKKALEYAYLMEVTYGGGTGAVNFEKAVVLLKSWVGALGWKLDVTAIMNAITAFVGALHTEQGKIPETIAAEITE